MKLEPGRPFIGRSAKLIYKPAFLDKNDMKRCLEQELEDISQAFHKLLTRVEALESRAAQGVHNGQE